MRLWGIGLKQRFILSMAIISAGLPVISGTQAAENNKSKRLTIGKTAISYKAPPGFCYLDRSNDSDRAMYELVGKAVNASNAVITILAGCEQLAQWRAGQVSSLDETLQLQVAKPFLYRDLNEKRTTVSKELCSQFRSMEASGDGNKTLKTVGQRISNAVKSIEVDQQKFLGVIEEAPDTCYAGILQRFQLSNGGSKTILGVMAVSVVRKKLVYYYRFSKFDNDAQVKAQLEETKRDMQRLYRANDK